MKNEEIGKLLKELRIKHGYTQLELAQKVNVTYQAVSRWEKGINTPNLLTLVALKRLYKISIDELLLEVEKNITEPVDKKMHWVIKYFLLPLSLIILSFGLMQFYFFLNNLYAMIVTSVVLGVLMSIGMFYLKTNHKGKLFLIALGSLILINGTIYLTNAWYFNLMEVPYYQEIDHEILSFDYSNTRPMSINYTIDDEPYVLIYHKQDQDIQIYQLNAELNDMMTHIPTNQVMIDDLVVVSNDAYFTSYDENLESSNLYQVNLVNHEITFIRSIDMHVKLVSSKDSLYLYQAFGGVIDYETTIYRLDGSDLEEVTTFSFEIVDMIYHEAHHSFYLSVEKDSLGQPITRGNILIYDEFFNFQHQIFDQDINGNMKLKDNGMHVLTSINYEIISILYNQVEYTGLLGEVDDLHNTGYYYLFSGDLMDAQWNQLSQTSFHSKTFKPMGASHIFYRELDSKLIAIDNNRLSLLTDYSRQVETIMIPSYLRHGIFFGVMPFIALLITVGVSKKSNQQKLVNETK